jgi:DNA-directed RNA polymerase subunit RPC12/RpoP
MTTTTVACGKCKAVLNEAPNMPVESRIPCPSCGSMTRSYGQINDGLLQFHSELKYKGKRGGKGKAFIKAMDAS